jgi:predicted dehydrogenase
MAEVVAAADTDPENLELFCKRFNLQTGYSDYREMLAKEEIDIAAPILPVSANPDAVVACAEAGVKAIFCEKPMAASLVDADRMVEACRSRGIPLAAGDAYRNFPQLWKAREMIGAGELGEVRSINLYQPTDEISGGGCQGLCVMSMFASDADVDWMVGWVSGDPFSDEDQGAGGYIRFVNGVEGFIHYRPVAKKGVEVLCVRGIFFSDWYSFRLWKATGEKEPSRWDDLREVEGLFPNSGVGDRSYDEEGWRTPGTRNKAGVQAIIDALENGTEPACSGEAMRRALEIGIALRESHRQGHAPIKLPLQDRSLKIVPHKSRWLNKKEVYGREWYVEQIRSWTKD